MKRSELVKIIEDTLMELVQKNLIDKDGFNICAEVIMKRIEKDLLDLEPEDDLS